VSMSDPLRKTPVASISDADLAILAAGDKFLRAHRLAEALYCDTCFENDVHNGCRAMIRQVGLTVEARIECRCTVRYGKGTGLH
jgi:hypothetical protein